MNEERKEGFWTAREKRGLKIAGMILTCLAVGYVLVRIWPLPQFFGHPSFWRVPTNVAAEKPATPPAVPASPKATLDTIAKDLATIKSELSGRSEITDSEGKTTPAVPSLKEQLASQIEQRGNFPWLYLSWVNDEDVWLTPNAPPETAPNDREPCQKFAINKVAFVSFAEEEGGVARRLTAKDNDESLLLFFVAAGREQAEEGEGFVVGLILADVGPPTTSLFVNGKTTTVGERCQRLVGELLAKEAKEKKSAEKSAE